jgi:hypothetical protein
MEKEKRAALLMDHYKDSYQHTLSNWNARNRLFMYVLILLAFVALDSYAPRLISGLVNAYTFKLVGEKAPEISLDIIGSAIWFLLLSLVIQYYKRSIQVDRQYRYLGHLEEEISKAMGGDYVTREGKAYLSKTGVPKKDQNEQRPLYLRWVGPLYTYFFPMILTFLVLVKIGKEGLPPHNVPQFFNLAIGVIMVVYNAIYVMWVKFKK